jgi:ribosomal protein L11 methyltransferase
MDWIEIAVAADDEAVEAVAEVLRTHGYGVAIDEPFLQPRLDEAPVRDPTRRAIVKTYIPDDAAAPQVQRTIEESLWHLAQLRAVEPLPARTIAEEDWANAWKSFFPVLHIGQRTVIVPAWRRHRRRDGELIVRLDPGLAFGTGMHPTTRLCLAAVETMVEVDDRVLDVGTGSGVLAIAAARLGARSIIGLDIDPIAVSTARKNVAMNRLSRTVDVREGSIGTLDRNGADLTADWVGVPARHGGAPRFGRAELGAFDVVLANVTARVNAALAPAFVPLLAPRGRLVASGIIEDAAHLVDEAFDEVGLKIVDRQQEGDWLAITAVLRDG